MTPSTGLPDFVLSLGHGIFLVDTGFHRPNFDAAYLIVEAGRGAFVDTGTNFSVPRLLATAQAAGLAPGDVDFVIPTHVHLDHAGGAGLLMQHLPNAQLVVHPLGARHLIDPSKLMAGARAVYGDEEVARSYGAVVGVPAERVLQTADGMTLTLAGRPLTFFDTPGHARHHHCIWDERSRGFFTGDTFGLSYREFDTAQGPLLMPTTTPVQFDPQALRTSVRRLMAQQPEAMYLTHYGRVGNVQALGASFLEQLDEMVSLAESLRGQVRAPADVPPADARATRHAALLAGLGDLSRRRIAAHGCTLPADEALALLAMDLELNAQGIGVWLDM